MRYRTALFIACGLMTATAPAFAQGIERRPCVAPGSPSGCDSVPTGPTKSLGDGSPLPEQHEVKSLARLPLSSPPANPSTSTSTSSDVSVKPVPPEGLDPAGAPGKGVGPTPR